MPVFVHSRVRCVMVHEQVVIRVVGQLLALVGEAASEVSIEFVGDARMRRLNREYRHKDRTTDVLAFACREAGGPLSPMLGDIVVSVPTAMRQAVSIGHSVNEELIQLLVHGLLHLVGYDHERNEKEAQRMRRKEVKLLAEFTHIPKLVK